ncbi:MAG: hypothetical protein PGN37_14185 [Mycobacterium kyogaense]|uniref:hypothetical protein n=1 Tax=Mycobacterium kyogaense TaxID=2212479 RepID=UPI002FFB2648
MDGLREHAHVDVPASESPELARERDLRARIQIGAAWCGVAFIVAFFAGWGLIAGFIPAPSPVKPQAEVVAYFTDNQYRIITGCIVTMGGIMFLAPFTSVVAAQMRRIEGPSRVLANTQVFSGAVTAAVATVSCLIFLVAAYRPDRNPDVTEMLSDFGFTTFIGPFAPAFAQCVVLALAIFSDRRPQPVYPRWVGYANAWSAVLFLPGPVLFYFLSGPFAWNGVAAFWIPANAFGAWFLIMTHATISAVRREREDLRRTHPAERR